MTLPQAEISRLAVYTLCTDSIELIHIVLGRQRQQQDTTHDTITLARKLLISVVAPLTILHLMTYESPYVTQRWLWTGQS